MNNFNVKPKIYFGANALDHLKELEKGKAFVIADPFMVKNKSVKMITNRLDAAGMDYEIFSDIVPDPPIEVVAKGMKVLDKCDPDVVIALGGGSAIDSAKLIVYFRNLVNKGLKTESTTKEVKFIAIPTTSGTGSEVTNFAVVTDKMKNVKYPLVDDSLLADETILDVELVKTVPKKITADTGIDVLTHAIEAYVSNKASDYSDALAEKAIKLVFRYLLKAYNDGSDEEAREKMHNASCIAGMAFTNASLGINHSMAHILGGRFHIPHGRANAILLPYVIEYNADIHQSYNKEYTRAALRYAEIAKMIGIESSNTRAAVRSLIAEIKCLTKKLGIPQSIKEAGISEMDFQKEIADISEVAMNDRCTETNPRVPNADEIKKLFVKVYNGNIIN